MIWILLLGVVALLFWYKFVKPLNHFTRIGVKQGKPWPIVGDTWPNLLRMKSFAEIMESTYNLDPEARYVGFYNSMLPILVLRDPELIKQISVKDFDHFTDHLPFVDPKVEPLWSNNLFSLQGQKWRDMRITLSGSFTSSKMKQMFEIINETAENFAQHFLKSKKQLTELEMRDTLARYTNDVIATAAFGLKVDSMTNPNNSFYLAGKVITRFTNLAVIIKFLILFAAPKLFKLLQLRIFSKEVTEYFQNVIHETIHVREEQGIVRQDMINLLLEARRGVNSEEKDVSETSFAAVKDMYNADKDKSKQPKYLSNDDITSQALIFFLAGFDTVSTALSFGSYELALNKEVQDKLRKEIVETHKANNGVLTYDVLLKMKYLDMVFSEILRKWAPVVAIDRVCTKPYTIEPINNNEKPVHLNVGDVVWLPMHVLHRDPKYYTDPEKFNPDRFQDENKDNIKPYTYIPFGAGPRACIGSRFAILEAKLLFYHVLLNFQIVPTEKTQIPLKLCVKSMEHTANDGYWLGLQRIKQN